MTGRREMAREALLPAAVVTGLCALVLGTSTDDSQIYILIDILTLAIFAVGMNLALGMAGQVSFGHAMFWGSGSYAVAILTTSGQHFLVALVVGIAVAGVLGLLFGYAALRVRGHYLAMLTFAGGQAVYLIARMVDFTGGVNGKSVALDQATVLGVNFTEPAPLAVVTLVVFFLAIVGYGLLKRAAFGRMLVGVRQDETLLVTAGIGIRQLKIAAFVLSALIGGLAGALNALAVGYVDPTQLFFIVSIDVVVVVTLGGLGATLAPFYGAVLLVGSDQLLTPYPAARLFVFGALLLFVLTIFPKGLDGVVKMVGRHLGRFVRDRRGTAATAGPPRAEPEAVSDEQLMEWLRPAEPAPPADPVVAVDRVTKSFGGVHAVSSVSLAASTGELLAIVGPNGAGKSSLFNCITNWIPADEGTVKIRGVGTTGLSPLEVTRLGVARSFQTPRVVGELTTLENATLIAHAPGHDTPEEQALALLHQVQLGDRAYGPASLLTHGERKRLELVRVLLERPLVMLLDEPFAGLTTPETELCTRLMELYAKAGGTVVFIEHDIKAVLRISTRVAVLEFGKVIAVEKPDVVMTLPAVIEAYLAGGSARQVPGAAV
jgi:ABC-type branched-subunit amino acid transport system permease subunit/ABC-type branched-subunit amino acid transport system ATPase component